MRINDMVPSVRGEVREESGHFILPENSGIDYGSFESWCAEAFCVRTGRSVDGSVEGKAAITLCRKEDLPKEGYELSVAKDGIRITAATEQGVVWALVTLAQMMEGEENNQISCGMICDLPRYAHRGLSLDCARHFFPADEVKKIIEEISLAKMNVLHWHLTDDQGWRIESRRFPKLNEDNEYFTQEEIREICEYARVRGVEIIPEIDMPGHVSALLHAYPEYSCSGKQVRIATAGGIYPIILCAGQEKVYTFLDELLEEVVSLFPGKRVHLGGDEAPKGEWKKCPYCQSKMQDLGLTQWEEMQGYFMTRAAEILKKYGKTAVCWNETLRAAMPDCDGNDRNNKNEAAHSKWQGLPDTIQIQYWTLQHRDSMEPFANKGGAWIYSDMFELYLDYPYSMTPLKKLYETVPHLGDTDVSGQENLLGLEGCLWSEHITDTEKLEKLLFPRTYAIAEICWSGSSDYEEFEERLGKNIASPLHPQLSYTPEDWWNPTGPERQQEAFGYMASIGSGMSDDQMEQTVESTAPNEEFGAAFMTKFFQPEDIPILMGNMGLQD